MKGLDTKPRACEWETLHVILCIARLVPSDCFDVSSFFGKEQSYEVLGGAQPTETQKGHLVLSETKSMFI